MTSTLKNLDVGQSGANPVNGESKLEVLKRKHEAKVLVIYTGGTIGMVKDNDNGYAPIPGVFEDKIRNCLDMHDEAYARNNNCDRNFLVLPDTPEEKRILYRIIEYNPLLDSTNMTQNNWLQIARDIGTYYRAFDGFVILHGTDTLSYTASALSFLLENLGKCVIVTGSQIPIFEIRSDGRSNFINALVIAGNYYISEVLVLFCNELLRGNRSTKLSSNKFPAFSSPNYPAIADVGIEIEVHPQRILRPNKIEQFKVHETLASEVAILETYPNMSASSVKALLLPPTRGVVLLTFGAGNFPSTNPEVLKELKAAVTRGVLIVNVSQCLEGKVCDLYEAGKFLSKIGVISGYDITVEAAFVKLCYVLSKDWEVEEMKENLKKSLRGELSIYLESLEENLSDILANSLHLSEERHGLKELIASALLQFAVHTDVESLRFLHKKGMDLSVQDFDLRTPLHLACAAGNVDVVEYLLENGAGVHMTDRFDRTALEDAIDGDFHDVIRLLCKCGAYLKANERLGEGINRAAMSGNILRLTSYWLAGCYLDTVNYNGETALQTACLHGQVQAVRYLLNHGCDKSRVNLLGQKSIDIADKMNYPVIVKMLE